MTSPRIFTVDEAQLALPLVRRIVLDLRTAYRAWQDAMSRYELLAAGVRAGPAEPEPLRAAREDATRHAAQVDGLVGELRGLGCESKDFELGLVDFYALREDRLVFLCWRLGEERVAHWHEVDQGFAGRQPIDEILTRGVVP